MYSWFEELPEQCPPKKSNPPDGKYYRLIHGEIPMSEDFISQAIEHPDFKYPNISECIKKAVSVFNHIDGCRRIKKLPGHKDKFIAEIVLAPPDGLILKTYKKHHYSWWRSTDFNLQTVTVLR